MSGDDQPRSAGGVFVIDDSGDLKDGTAAIFFAELCEFGPLGGGQRVGPAALVDLGLADLASHCLLVDAEAAGHVGDRSAGGPRRNHPVRFPGARRRQATRRGAAADAERDGRGRQGLLACLLVTAIRQHLL